MTIRPCESTAAEDCHIAAFAPCNDQVAGEASENDVAGWIDRDRIGAGVNLFAERGNHQAAGAEGFIEFAVGGEFGHGETVDFAVPDVAGDEDGAVVLDGDGGWRRADIGAKAGEGNGFVECLADAKRIAIGRGGDDAAGGGARRGAPRFVGGGGSAGENSGRAVACIEAQARGAEIGGRGGDSELPRVGIDVGNIGSRGIAADFFAGDGVFVRIRAVAPVDVDVADAAVGDGGGVADVELEVESAADDGAGGAGAEAQAIGGIGVDGDGGIAGDGIRCDFFVFTLGTVDCGVNPTAHYKSMGKGGMRDGVPGRESDRYRIGARFGVERVVRRVVIGVHVKGHVVLECGSVDTVNVAPARNIEVEIDWLGLAGVNNVIGKCGDVD
jgi:hypothetical protein